MLDLFAGAGELSIGLARAGLRPVAAVETMEDAAQTYEAHHGVGVDRRRVEQIPPGELRALGNRVSVIAGGPPCQPWSVGGHRRGDADERDGFGGMFRALDYIRPQAFIIENVAGLERGTTREHFLDLIGALRDELGLRGRSRDAERRRLRRAAAAPPALHRRDARTALRVPKAVPRRRRKRAMANRRRGVEGRAGR
jgi:site-specific DNA-cytosine methylase